MQPSVVFASGSGRAATGMHPYSSSLSKADIKRLAAHANKRVIVLMKNQHASLQPGVGHLAARTAATRSTESSVVSELRALHANNLHAYKLISAVSATVSAAEAARLRTDPAVRAVVPDRQVQRPAATPALPATGTATTPPPVVKANHVPGTCPKNPSKPLLPEALSVMHATAAQKIANGHGVKVAVFPDGVDPTITDFKRPGSNQPVIFDYRDWSGEGITAETGGAEAFGDVSSIASQGRQVYDLSKEVDSQVPLPANCNIRVLGVAPGASVAVMKVFGENSIPFNSEILEGLDYAVNVDHVDILSESFGGNPLPDLGTQDPIALFNTAAVKNGVTVVVSTGDAGTTNTIGTPATAPGVIAAAASTTYQIYAQTSSYGAYLGDSGGWQSDNIAPISSSGITESAHTADVAAPGDGNWVDCSPDTTTYTECVPPWPNAAQPQPILPFGGTSESCPLTAAAAALVIEAYRNSHGGATPAPTLVKQILKSSATDLGAPAENQGAGLVNAYRAVQIARSVPGSGVKHPAHHARTLLLSKTDVTRTGTPGSALSFTEKVTNLGAKSRKVSPRLTHFVGDNQIASGSVKLKSGEPQMVFIAQAGSSGYQVPYTSTTFVVPSGTNRLVTRIAWDGSVGSGVVRGSLFDPKGRMIANSRPQGASPGFGEIEARNPIPGRYRLVVFPTSPPLFSGKVNYTVFTQQDASTGSVTPASATIPAGGTRTFHVHAALPSSAGDVTAALRFNNAAGAVPVIERALITPTVQHPGHFSTTITGGNARPSLYGIAKWFQFDVPKNVKDVDVDMAIAHKGYDLLAFLVDPKGVPQDVTSSLYLDQSPAAADPAELKTMHLSWATPTPGRWGLIIAVTQGQTSGQTSTHLDGTVAFNTVHVTASGLPQSKAHTIAAGKSVHATIQVSNTGNSPEAYYVDPRLNTTETVLPPDDGVTSGNLPITFADDLSQFFVPPFSSSVTIVAQSHGPGGTAGGAPRIDFDTSSAFGSPDVLSTTGTSAVATISGSDLASSEYSCTPTIVKSGGFTDVPTAGGTYDCGASVVTKTFDDFVTSSTGDLWNGPDYSPLVLQPGQTGEIDVTISAPADAPDGYAVNGFLPVMTFDPATVSGDHLISFPYAYSFTAGSGS